MGLPFEDLDKSGANSRSSFLSVCF